MGKICAVGYISRTYPKSRGLRASLLEIALGDDYDEALGEVEDAHNHLHCTLVEDPWYNFFNPTDWTNCSWDCGAKEVEAAQIEDIINCYYNGVVGGSIKQFDPPVNGGFSPNDTQRWPALFQWVARCAGVTDIQASYVLKALWVGANSGWIYQGNTFVCFDGAGERRYGSHLGRILYPKDYESNTQNRTKPESGKNVIEEAGDAAKKGWEFVEDLLGILKWAVIIGVVGVIAFYGYQLYQGYGSGNKYGSYNGGNE